MKNTLIIATAGLLFTMLACQKKKVTSVSDTEETIEVNLSANQAYRYQLPAAQDESPYVIQTASARSANVSIETNNGTSTLVYVPTQSGGTDNIVVSNAPLPQHGGCNRGGKHGQHPHHGKPGKHKQGEKSSHKINFNFSVTNVSH